VAEVFASRGFKLLKRFVPKLRVNRISSCGIAHPWLVSRIVDSLLFSGGAQPSNQEIHRHEYEGNQQLGTLAT
jgi:hypothetical protein